MPVYTIPFETLTNLQAKVAKLARKGNLALAVLGHTNIIREGKVYPHVQVEITGTIPVINGWKLQARVDHVGALNVINALPGTALDLTPFRECHSTCDHCHTNRDRSSTFVLLHTETGATQRIGRNCLADFCRSSDVDQFVALAVAMATLTRDLEEAYSSSGTGYDCIRYYLAKVAVTIQEKGWVSSAKSKLEGCTPTSELAMIRKEKPTESELELAGKILLWAKQLPATSDYAHNLRAACSLDYVTSKHRGIVASAAQGYLNAEAEAAKPVSSLPSEYLAPVASKVSFKATLTRVSRTQGQYGITTILSMVTPAGNALTWFASGELDYSAGQTVEGKGTVKAHNTFKAEKQTILTRCKLTII